MQRLLEAIDHASPRQDLVKHMDPLTTQAVFFYIRGRASNHKYPRATNWTQTATCRFLKNGYPDHDFWPCRGYISTPPSPCWVCLYQLYVYKKCWKGRIEYKIQIFCMHKFQGNHAIYAARTTQDSASARDFPRSASPRYRRPIMGSMNWIASENGKLHCICTLQAT